MLFGRSNFLSSNIPLCLTPDVGNVFVSITINFGNS